MGQEIATLDRVSTGNRELDEILGGGIPAGSVTVITGNPGSGKTVLALQQLFTAAREGRRCLYVTTLSEPALKIVRYMQLFDFFDASLLDERIRLRDLGDTLLTEGAVPAQQRLQALVEEEEPELVVIDSFKVFHDLLDPSEVRPFVYELAVSLSSWGATTLLLGEYTADEPMDLPEFAIADGIVRLGSQRYGLASVRELQVLKMRGVDYAEGVHLFDIMKSGLHAYPRLQAPPVKEPGEVATRERVAFGLASLDDLLDGGLPRGSSTLVQGATGTGKTILGLRFLATAAERGERAIHFGLEETPHDLRRVAGTFGWRLDPSDSASSSVRFVYTSPIELVADRFLHEALQAADEAGATRVVLDSLGTLRDAVGSHDRFRDLVYAFSRHMAAREITTLFLVESPELLGTNQLTTHMAASVVDNVILMRYVEERGTLVRALSVLKARGVRHSSELRRFMIEPDGPKVGGAFNELRGVLTGVPEPLGFTPPPPRGDGAR